MHWKTTAAMSGIGLVATWMASVPPSPPPAPVARPPAPAPAPVVTPIEIEADRLARGMAFEARLATSSRNPFRFGAAPAPAGPPASAAAPEAPLVPAAPPTPPVALAGVATEVVDGVTVRTAILSGPAGVRLVAVGDGLSGGYRVTAIRADAVDLSAPDAGPGDPVVTIRLTP